MTSHRAERRYRYRPLREAFGGLDAAFERAFGLLPAYMGDGEWGYEPPVDIYETPDAYVVRAWVPGVDPGQLRVTIDKGLLTIEGRVADPAEDQAAADWRWHRRECVYGEVRRSIQLPTPLDQEQAQADFRNGMVTLTLPKAAGAKPTHIPVRTPHKQLPETSSAS